MRQGPVRGDLRQPRRPADHAPHTKNGKLTPASWDEALDLTAEKLVEHRGATAALASAKATNEDGYILQKFMRMAMGTNSIDHCTRLCHSPSVEAMLRSLGSGATSNSYLDYEKAGCLIIAGCDPSSNHPVAATRFRKAVDLYGAKLIVINPKRIDLCDYAYLWLRERPGTDVALFNGMAKVIMDEGLWDRKFVNDTDRGVRGVEGVAGQVHPRLRRVDNRRA